MGVALAAVLLLGTAIALLAHAGVVLGLALERSARSDARSAEVDAHLAARLESTSGTLASLDDSLPAGVEGRRLSPELLRLRADSAGRGRARLLWAPDPQTRIDALVAGVRTSVSLTPMTADRIAVSASDSCGTGLDLPPGFVMTATVPWGDGSPRTLGPLDSADWADLPPPPPGGAPESGAWRAEGPLTLTAGSWSGLLVVEGALTVEDAAELSGWVAVTGDVEIRAGGRIEGVVQTGSGVMIESGGMIDVAPCRAARGLVGLPPFAFPVLVGAEAWPSDPAG